jgi:hypothetical protein
MTAKTDRVTAAAKYLADISETFSLSVAGKFWQIFLRRARNISRYQKYLKIPKISSRYFFLRSIQ